MNEIAFLKQLLSIPSPSGEEDAVAGYLVEQMTMLGFRTRRDRAGNVIGEVGDPGSRRTIVLLGHVDTVPGHVPIRQRGNRLYGRGAVDAKGPLAAFVLAAARVARQPNTARVMVIGAVEEENHSRGAHHLVHALPPPDYAIVGEPGGWEGITLGYKGVLSLEYRLARPAGHHAGERPPPVEEAIAFWNRLVDYAAALNRERSRRFDTLDPILRAIHTSGDGLEERVEMSIRLQLPPGVDVTALQELMQTWCDGAKLTCPYDEPPFWGEKNTPPVRALLRAIRAEGGRPRFKLKTGTSDMNVVGPVWRCPIVAYGPGDSSLDHTPDEHVDVQEFRRAVEVLTRALETLCNAG